MVNTEEAPQTTPENTGTFGKLKQTLSSSLLTAQDKGKFPQSQALNIKHFF